MLEAQPCGAIEVIADNAFMPITGTTLQANGIA
jgi:hypothetical protein